MTTTVEKLKDLFALLRAQKATESVALCAAAFGSPEVAVRDLGSMVSGNGFHEIAMAIAGTLDATEEQRDVAAVAITAATEVEFMFDSSNPNRPLVEKAARRLARL